MGNLRGDALLMRGDSWLGVVWARGYSNVLWSMATRAAIYRSGLTSRDIAQK